MRILLAGKNGQLGRCFQDAIARTTHELIALSSQELDVTNSSQVKEVVNKFRPDVIVNASAYTAVDKAESDQEMAYAVNHSGVEYLAKAAQSLAIPVIHVSTDYVFDGAAVEPYLPSDETNPQTVYGNSKLAGENALSEHCTQYLVLRTAWVFSEYGNNFVKTMLRLMAEKPQLGVVSDQIGSPTWAKGLAQACWAFAKNTKTGIYHYSDLGVASWYDFAVAIQELAIEKGLLEKQIPINPIKATAYPTPAKRPAYSVMNTDDTYELLGEQGKHWRAALSEMLNDLKM